MLSTPPETTIIPFLLITATKINNNFEVEWLCFLAKFDLGALIRQDWKVVS